MAISRRNAGILVALFLVVGYVFLMFPSYDDQAPSVAYHDGVPSEILNCEPPPPGKAFRCSALYCQKALYERKLVRAYTQVFLPRHQYNFSDAPGRSVHFATWTQEDRPLIARCEMKGYDVVSIDFVESLPQ
jgi:hypothetical protein